MGFDDLLSWLTEAANRHGFVWDALEVVLRAADWLHEQIVWWLAQSPEGSENRRYVDSLR